jgi:hypothetical protein
MNKTDAERDYENKSLAILLQDIKRGGVKEVTDEYFLGALGWPLTRRYDLHNWITRFAKRHNLIFTHYSKIGRTKMIRATG